MSLIDAELGPRLVQDKPWRSHQVDLSARPATMLSDAELGLLHWLTSKYFTGLGAVIDAGCFLGGSTYALVNGLLNNTKTKVPEDFQIHTYDLFQAIGDSWGPELRKQYELTNGDDFLPIFERNIGSLRKHVKTHAGDLLLQSWSEELPIEILFLDVCKTPELHDHAMAIWFPRLIAGKSIVIQQDYGWSNYPWGNIAMAALGDFFEVLDDLPYATRVYRCVKPITAEDVAKVSWRTMSNERKSYFMSLALDESRGTRLEPHMLVNRAMIAREAGDNDEACRILFEVFYNFASDPAADAAGVIFPELLAGPEAPCDLNWFGDLKMDLICQMNRDERLFLYATTLAQRPRRILEIGRARGGSTLIFSEAIKHLPGCKFVSVDPNCLTGYKLTPEIEKRLAENVTLIHGFSPYENENAMKAAGGKFDLVFIDGDHTYEPCLRDIRGVLPYLEDDAVILLHDAFYPEVADAIQQAIVEEKGLVDCGMPARQANDGLAHLSVRGRPRRYAGVHMLRWRPLPVEVNQAETATSQRLRTPVGFKTSIVHPLRHAMRRLRGKTTSPF